MKSTDFASASLPRKALYLVTIVCVVLLLFAAYFFAIPPVQALFLPEAPANGWLVKPIVALRFCAAVFLGAFTIPVVQPMLRRHGLFPQPATKPLHPALWAQAVYSSWLVVAYFLGGVFYFSAYTLVTDEEIRIQNLVFPRRYGMGDIDRLLEVPRGFRVDKKDGPILDVRFRDGRRESLSLDCEGLTDQDLRGIRSMLSARTGKDWERDPEAVPHP